jgi:hypothetical protein
MIAFFWAYFQYFQYLQLLTEVRFDFFPVFTTCLLIETQKFISTSKCNSTI